MPLVEDLSSPFFSGDCVVQSLVFCVLFCRPLFVSVSFFFWPLHCLSFELRHLITVNWKNFAFITVNNSRFWSFNFWCLFYFCMINFGTKRRQINQNKTTSKITQFTVSLWYFKTFLTFKYSLKRNQIPIYGHMHI